MGKYRFAYWFILITTLIMESSLQILYSYVTKKTLNAIEFQNMQLFRTAVVVCVVIVILKCLFPYLRYFQIRLVRKMVYELSWSIRACSASCSCLSCFFILDRSLPSCA